MQQKREREVFAEIAVRTDGALEMKLAAGATARARLRSALMRSESGKDELA